jgi:hypothetical protein
MHRSLLSSVNAQGFGLRALIHFLASALAVLYCATRLFLSTSRLNVNGKRSSSAAILRIYWSAARLCHTSSRSHESSELAGLFRFAG